MEKFSKIINKPIEILKDFTVYKGSKISVLQNKETEWIKTNDKIFILPYIVDENSFLLKNEPVTPFISKYKEKTHFLTAIGGNIKGRETCGQAIKRKLYEDCGILLSDSYKIEYQGPFFYSKLSEDQYYISVIVLTPIDYRKTFIPILQSEYDKNSMLLKIDLKDINNILITDIYTTYMLNYLKKILGLK